MKSNYLLSSLTFVVSMALPNVGGAEVIGIEIESRGAVLNGHSFGDAGTYEVIHGTLIFGLDSANEFNQAIVDLNLAPLNDQGLVEASANFFVLRPKELERSAGVALLEVSNRGGKAMLSYFQGARGDSMPNLPEHFGDGFLMEQGFTLIWVGWQHDVPRELGKMILNAPVATNNGDAIEGLVRSDWTVEESTYNLALAHRNHQAYPVLNPDSEEHVLTVRDGRLAERTVVPRDQWQFAIRVDDQVKPSETNLYAPKKFDGGKIYELVYRSKDPVVSGIGLAAIRDTMSFIKNDPDCPFPANHGIALGISQTGRFLRHFLYQGFNTDESGRAVMDGLLIHTAGAGRGSFNHRFAQPSRDAHRYSAFFYPTDLYPFTSRAQQDAATDRNEGLLDVLVARGHVPKIFYTNTGYEYWGRAASLIHTSIDGGKDIEPLAEERIYHLRGTQHFPWNNPPLEQFRIGDTPQFLGNSIDLLSTEKALLMALVSWVKQDQVPPPSSYPRIDNQTLVSIDKVKFPAIPKLQFPKVIHQAYRADYGPEWSKGIVSQQPPKLGPAFPSLVSQVDALGNEVAGVPTVDVLVPLGTYTPWLLRMGMGSNEHELRDFYGGYIPFARTEEERSKSADPRPSRAALYSSKDDYLAKVREAAETLIAQRLLLPSDLAKTLARAEERWDW